MRLKIDMSKLVLMGAISLISAGCAAEAFEPPTDVPMTPGFGIHKTPPKKTIPIKRKKPTILNPSPRPLSAEAPIEEYYEEWKE